jgi:hypothetical protein
MNLIQKSILGKKDLIIRENSRMRVTRELTIGVCSAKFPITTCQMVQEKRSNRRRDQRLGNAIKNNKERNTHRMKTVKSYHSSSF